ncbi:hypothetical protein [Metabacillus sp. Hm71]|uniref:hypothetical protein n=1 Tax=Metabacillus sp. Hm71 TaxID=3450743 RepID=UPI003F427F36
MSYVIYQGDSGITFSFTVMEDDEVVDIRGATVDVIIRYKAKRTVKTATITDGLNGKCEITLIKSDTEDVGVHPFQVTVKFPDGKEFSSDKHQYFVEKKY